MKALKLRLAACAALVLGLVFAALDARAVTIDTDLLPNGMEMVAYDQSLSASGGTSPYTWSVASQMMTRRANTWSEVATLGTKREWYHDDNAWPLELPFAFPFYGETYTYIWISSNGNIYFTNDGTSNPCYSMGNEYTRDESKLRNAKKLSVCWCDSASSADHPIYTLTESGRVVVRFDAARDNGGGGDHQGGGRTEAGRHDHPPVFDGRFGRGE